MTKSLKVHRNTVERRFRKEMQGDMIAAAKSMGKQDVMAYAIVAITSDGCALADWNTGSIMPLWAFGPTISAALDQDIRESGVEETWKPSLSERKGLTE